MSTGTSDTIAACATAPGVAAIAVVRLSGPRAREIAERVTHKSLVPRRADYCAFRSEDGETIDRGVVIYFPGPASFTGEDVVELQSHGGPVVVDWLLETLYAHGARPAEAGEFSLRAYLNDKLDLTQAEAVADLIASGSRQAATAAVRSLEGRFADEVASVQAQLTELRVLCEAWLDFPEEEIDRAGQAELERRGATVASAIADLQDRAESGVVLNDGFSVAIAGPPNAGKSSLINRLAGTDAAIVSDLPGTTRDVIQARIVVDGLVVEIVDTAGLRESADLIEQEGIRRAESAIGRADHVLWIHDVREAGRDASDALAAARGRLTDAELRSAAEGTSPFTLVLNKVDLVSSGDCSPVVDGVPVIELSALTGAGVERLTDHLKQLAGLGEPGRGTFSARRRHLAALERARSHIATARPHLNGDLELAAEELRAAQEVLSEVTGEVSSDDLLGEIFSTFCIGK